MVSNEAVQFEAPAIVPAAREDNITDLLEQRVQKTPSLALFSVPDGDGWRDVTAAEFPPRSSRWRRASSRRASSRARRSASSRAPATSGPSSTSRLVTPARCMVPIYETSSPAQMQWILEDSGAIAVIVETAGALRPLRRGARRPPPRPRRCGSCTSATSTSSPRQGRDVPDEEIERRRSIANGADIAHADLHLRLHRPAEGLRAHALQLRRALPQLGRGAHGGRVNAGRRIHTAVHHDRARVRAVHLGARACTRGVKVGHQADTSQLLPALGSLQADLPARRAARVREGLQLGRAEGGGGRQGQDLPRGRRRRRRALQGRRGRARRAARAAAQVRAVRPARVPQAARRDGRPGEVTRSPDRRRSAPASGTSSTASASRSSRATASPRRPPRRP